MVSYEQSTENLLESSGGRRTPNDMSIHLAHFIQASVSLLINIREGFLREPYTAFSTGGVILRHRPQRCVQHEMSWVTVW